MIDKFVSKTMVPVKKALKDASLNSKDIDEIILVGGSTRIPSVRAAVEKFFGKNANSSVNPDEVVAMGAAVQGGVFSGDVNDILLLDVTPLSLGLETLGGIMTRLIDRNTTIPCAKTETFSTAADSQSAVDINVLQGERDFAKHNRALGKFQLTGIPPAPRGMPQIEVTFDIDANGIVNVSAKDKATGKEQSITIAGNGSLTDEEIEKMVGDAAENESADKLKREYVETKNKLDVLIYQSENVVKENEDKISSEHKDEFDKAIQEAKEALNSVDTKRINDAMTALSDASTKIATELYQSSSEDDDKEGPDTSDQTINVDYQEASQ